MIDLEPSPEQQSLAATVRRFVEARAPIAPYVRSMLDDPRGTSDDVWQGLADLGLLGLLVPIEHGGSGADMVTMGFVLHEMGRAVHPGPFLSSAIGAVSAVTAVGTTAEQADLLPGLAEGSLIATLALFEPGRRADWRRPATVARRSSEGAWALDGAKSAVTDGVAADLLLVSAQDGGGLGLFAVEAGAPGLDLRPVVTVDGTRKFANVALSGTPARRLGSGPTTELLAGVVDRLVVALVSDGLGAAEAALELAVAYAKERVQFGRPIGSFQAVQHLCADMFHAVELGRGGVAFAQWAVDGTDEAERHRAACMTKAYAGDAFVSVGANAIQVLGGIGYTWEHDVHLFYKRLLTLQQTFGTTAEHLEEVASILT